MMMLLKDLKETFISQKSREKGFQFSSMKEKES